MYFMYACNRASFYHANSSHFGAQSIGHNTNCALKMGTVCVVKDTLFYVGPMTSKYVGLSHVCVFHWFYHHYFFLNAGCLDCFRVSHLTAVWP